MSNALNWFEIPVEDMERAMSFYGAILGAELSALEPMPDFTMAMLPASENGVGGAIVKGESYTPTQEGTIVYLNGGEDLSQVLDRVSDAGGQVLMPKTDIGENGFVAFFKDTEGNKVGLHSMN